MQLHPPKRAGCTWWPMCRVQALTIKFPCRKEVVTVLLCGEMVVSGDSSIRPGNVTCWPYVLCSGTSGLWLQ